MKLINKGDLHFIDGYLVTHDGTVITACNKVADQYNELMEIRELNNFLKKNKDDILASTDKVVYRLEKTPVPAFEYEPEIKTPFRDRAMHEAEVMALEFLSMKNAEDVATHLARYDELAKWFAEDHILQPEHCETAPIRFSGNILDLEKQDVIDIIVEMFDPEISTLADMIVVGFQ